jgi:hypothetical protein
MELIFDSVDNGIQYFLGNSTELCVIIGDFNLRFEELIEEHISVEVNNGCPGKFKATLR